MPPCTWMLSCALRKNAGIASTPRLRPRARTGRRRSTRRVPPSHTAAVAELGRHQHVGAVVLHRLEHRDRSTELLAHLGVLRRAVDAFLRTARGLGADEQPGDVTARRTPRRGAPVGVLHRDVVEHDSPAATGRVEVARDGDGAARRIAIYRDDVVADDEQEQVGEPDAEHDASVAPHHVAVEAQVAVEPQRRRPAPVGQGREERGALRGSPCRREDGRREHRRQERPGRERASELLQHDDELGKAVTTPADGFGQVQPEPAEPDEIVPERGKLLLGRVEQRRGSGARTDLLEERARDLFELTMGVGDGDRHAAEGTHPPVAPSISVAADALRSPRSMPP